MCRGGRGWRRRGEVDGEERVIETNQNRDVRDVDDVREMSLELLQNGSKRDIHSW